MDRRGFLKISTASAVAAATASAGGQESFPGWPNRLGMLTDTTLCIGAKCRKCEEACKKANSLPPHELPLSDDSVFDKARRTDHDNFTIVNRYENPANPENPIYVKTQCMHCNEPACASACLVRAFTKTPEGPVIYNKDVCIGCRYCMLACPFYMPTYDYFRPYDPQVRKCTMCYSRIREGKIPACAEVCPKEAITFGKREDLIDLAREKMRNHPGGYNNHIYGEHEVGGTSWLYLAGTEFADIGFSENLGETPYPSLTRGFLGAVPLVLTIWPVFLVGLYKFSNHRAQVETGAKGNAERMDSDES